MIDPVDTGSGSVSADDRLGAPNGGSTRTPSLVDALLPLIMLAVLIGGSLALFGLDALGVLGRQRQVRQLPLTTR